eukprot:1690703-Amphidinium_carterae.1
MPNQWQLNNRGESVLCNCQATSSQVMDHEPAISSWHKARCKSTRVRSMHSCKRSHTMESVAQIWSLTMQSQTNNMQMMREGHTISLARRISLSMRQMALNYQHQRQLQ